MSDIQHRTLPDQNTFAGLIATFYGYDIIARRKRKRKRKRKTLLVLFELSTQKAMLITA